MKVMLTTTRERYSEPKWTEYVNKLKKIGLRFERYSLMTKVSDKPEPIKIVSHQVVPTEFDLQSMEELLGLIRSLPKVLKCADKVVVAPPQQSAPEVILNVNGEAPVLELYDYYRE